MLYPIGKSKLVYQAVLNAADDLKLKLGADKTEVFRKSKDQLALENITHEVEKKGNGKRELPQYLGFHFDGKNMVLRPSTIAKHIRKGSRAGYMKNAYKKTLDTKLARQINRTRSGMNRNE